METILEMNTVTGEIREVAVYSGDEATAILEAIADGDDEGLDCSCGFHLTDFGATSLSRCPRCKAKIEKEGK